MNHDYKSNTQKASSGGKGNPFLTGLIVGVLLGVAISVVFTIYIKGGTSAFTTKTDPAIAIDPKDGKTTKEEATSENAEPAKPRFEFYNILQGNEPKVTEQEIKQVNASLAASAFNHHYEYVDLYNHFVDSNGRLSVEYTNDGLHLLATAYLKWKALIINKVYDLPSLIPMPNKVDWIKGSFSLSDCSGIIIEDDKLFKDATYLQTQFANKGFKFSVYKKPKEGKKYVYLQLGHTDGLGKYKLSVSADRIILDGADLDGLFYGIQTIMQLVTGQNIKACNIEDQPAFNWRGYMVDVGRNYQSMDLILKQIHPILQDQDDRLMKNTTHFLK